MTEKPRCQAILLMPDSRYWKMKRGTGDIRCRYPAKEGNFCGVHQKLIPYIESIIWKENDGSGT